MGIIREIETTPQQNGKRPSEMVRLGRVVGFNEAGIVVDRKVDRKTGEESGVFVTLTKGPEGETQVVLTGYKYEDMDTTQMEVDRIAPEKINSHSLAKRKLLYIP